MRALLQRVDTAKVEIEGNTAGEIGVGLLIFVCAMPSDNNEIIAGLASKIAKLRIFPDEMGRMNHSLYDIKGAALVVSQFTLASDTSRGNRPGFSSGANPEAAERLYKNFCSFMRNQNIPVETGDFGADMRVHIVNNGPATIWLDTEE